jgi:hypothetical protein
MSEPTTQQSGKVADSDASLTRYLRAKVFQLVGEGETGREGEMKSYEQGRTIYASLIIPWSSLYLVELLRSGRAQLHHS